MQVFSIAVVRAQCKDFDMQVMQAVLRVSNAAMWYYRALPKQPLRPCK